MQIALKSILLKYNVRFVIFVSSIVCAVLTLANFVLEQPYYVGKPYNYWDKFQDYTQIYPSFVNTVQILSHNTYGRYFYQRSLPG
jgi:hypothetical protein